MMGKGTQRHSHSRHRLSQWPARWSYLLKEQQSELRQKRCSLTCLTSVETFGSSPRSPPFGAVMSTVISLICIMPTRNLRTTPLSVFIKTADIPLIGIDTGSHYCRWVGCRPLSGSLSAVLSFLQMSTEKQCSHPTIRTQFSDVMRCLAFCWEQIRWNMLINMKEFQ